MTTESESIFSRLSGRTGNLIGLNVTFSRNGVLANPFALRRVDIYKQSVSDDNLVAQVLFGTPDDTGYPAPAIPDLTTTGGFTIEFQVPETFEEGIYFDVWRFIGAEPDDLSGYDYDDENLWFSQCNKFWLFKDGWYLDDGLLTPRFAFEPLDKRFRKGETRNLEVSIMPLPLYDWDQSRFGPMIPQILPYITIETEEGEIFEGL